MRMTNNMMITNMMRNLNRNMLRLDHRQMQVSTGKRVHKPSDDPIAISRSLKIRADISELEQHRKNVEDAVSWMETTELATKNMGEALQRVRELTVQASNGVLTSEETFKIQNEVKELKAQIIGLSNTTYSGKYVFSGKKTDTPLLDQHGNYNVLPFNSNDSDLLDHRMKFEVGVSEMLDINILGADLLETSGLSLNFPKKVGVDHATTFKLEGLEITLEMNAADDFTSTVNVTNEAGQVFSSTIANQTREDISHSIATATESLIDVNIDNPYHPLKNFEFAAIELKSNEDTSIVEWNMMATPQKAGLINLIDSLERNMVDGKSEELSKQLGDIDKYLNKLLNTRSEVGAKVNRMELVRNRIMDDKINFRTLQSQLEDADMGEVLMELMNEENVYKAALSVGARVIQPTLLDFLR